MIARFYFQNLHIAPKKLRFLIDDVKKMKPVEALDRLYYSPKKSSLILYKSLYSAVQGAKNTLKVADDLLQFKLLSVDEGYKLRRFRAGGRGTAKMFKRRFSHIRIELTATQKPKKIETPKKKVINAKAKKATK